MFEGGRVRSCRRPHKLGLRKPEVGGSSPPPRTIERKCADCDYCYKMDDPTLECEGSYYERHKDDRDEL